MYLEVKDRPRFLIEETIGNRHTARIDEQHRQTVIS
jgi:hypothetical protein